jgi:small subunit ribosomal protein S7
VQCRDGVTHQVPTQVNPERQQTLAIRWLIEGARAKGGRPLAQRLAEELAAACQRGPRSI